MPDGISKAKKTPRNARMTSLNASIVVEATLQDITSHPVSAVEQPPRASLLGLPTELRNWIYRLVVVEEDYYLIISPEDHEQPALLKTCRQIRNEATKIFEEENLFSIEVEDYKLVCPPATHWFATHLPKASFEFEGGELVWSNVKAWIKRAWDSPGTIPLPDCVGPYRGWEVAKVTFDLAKKLTGTSWDKMEIILKGVKDAVHETDNSLISHWDVEDEK